MEYIRELYSTTMFSLVLFVMLGAISVTADQCNAPTSESCDANILACCDKNFRESLNIHTRCDGKAIYENATCAMQSVVRSTYSVTALDKPLAPVLHIPFLNNNKCMVNTAISNMGQFDTCRSEFVANVKADPDRTCDYMKEIEGCFEKPFLSDCGVEAAWWGCEITRLSTSIIFPQCGGFCAAVTDAKTIS
ncbi:hypothetical protein Ddc_02024 [Ditylenchus destructor]|nr:hypothetical protein Ddc_02024 [Ditylenchus destructor]